MRWPDGPTTCSSSSSGRPRWLSTAPLPWQATVPRRKRPRPPAATRRRARQAHVAAPRGPRRASGPFPQRREPLRWLPDGFDQLCPYRVHSWRSIPVVCARLRHLRIAIPKAEPAAANSRKASRLTWSWVAPCRLAWPVSTTQLRAFSRILRGDARLPDWSIRPMDPMLGRSDSEPRSLHRAGGRHRWCLEV